MHEWVNSEYVVVYWKAIKFLYRSIYIEGCAIFIE